MRIEDTQIVKAAREEVFEKWTDCEAWPTWLPVCTRVDVTQRAGNVVSLSLDMKVKGLTLKRTETHVLTPPEKVEVEGAIRGVTNTTLWTFQEVPDGTRVSALVEAAGAADPFPTAHGAPRLAGCLRRVRRAPVTSVLHAQTHSLRSRSGACSAHIGGREARGHDAGRTVPETRASSPVTSLRARRRPSTL